jgi:hypothetical protein
MKRSIYTYIFCIVCLASCKKNIDLYPLSNVTTATFYKNTTDIQTALIGCYNGLQKPLLEEWKLSELRSDNTIMGNPSSKSVPNRDLSDLDLFIPNTSHQGIYNFWISSYANIRNVNVILNSLNVNYSKTNGIVAADTSSVQISVKDKKEFSAEAAFIRAYHYFNLVRQFGAVFLVHEPLSPFDATSLNRESVDEVYKLIIADLNYAIINGVSLKYASLPTTTLGRVNTWTAKAMLAKVYLTLNRKAEAITLLNDIVLNSGYGLAATYSEVFSISNEMNKEILFSVRYKAGGIGLGSPFPNYFAPELSGTAVIIGDGGGFNTPSSDLNLSYAATDLRKGISIGEYGSTKVLYPKKMISPVSIVNDAENDWIVMRYADVLLMLAEAQGNSTASVALINQTRKRAGLADLLPAAVSTVALFEKELANERRLEFAFENIRWYDLLRYNKTMTTITAEQTLKNHYSAIYSIHYGKYPSPRSTLAQIQAFITSDRLILPIPQREIDNNTTLKITQNPGY